MFPAVAMLLFPVVDISHLKNMYFSGLQFSGIYLDNESNYYI
jgi:hypothetical protein